MKLFLIMLMTLGVALSQTQATEPISNPIKEQVKELIGKIPMDKIHVISEEHLKQDPGYQAAVNYLKSSEWKQIVKDVRDVSEWKFVKEAIKEFGVDLNLLIDHVSHCLEAVDIRNLNVEASIKPNLTLFLNDVQDELLVPVMKGISNFIESIGEENLHKLAKEPNTVEIKNSLDKALKTKQVQTMIDKLQEMGINLKKSLWFVASVLGWDPEKLGL